MTSHTLPRIHLPHTLAEDKSITLDIAQAHYLQHVLRLKAGDEIKVFNVADGEWIARLQTSGKRTVTAMIEHLSRASCIEIDIWLCCAPIRKAHFDYMLEKACELGVSAIKPILTAHSQVRDLNIERATSIVTEAAEQSERLSVPTIAAPLPLTRLLSDWPLDRTPLLCAERGDAEPAHEGLIHMRKGPAAVFIGPEGGFTSEEFELLKRLPHVITISLGTRILRADTAAIAALSLWQTICGDWRSPRTANG